MTGQYPHVHGILGNETYTLDERNENTLPAVFRRMGYETALVGKSHSIRLWDEEAFEHIRYCDFADGDRNDPLSNHYFKYLYENQIADLYDLGTLPDDHPGKDFSGYVSDIPERHSLETWTGDMALQFLQQRDSSRPFFLHLSFQRPHEPYTVPYDTGLLYDPADIRLPDNAADWFEHGFASKPSWIVENAKKNVAPYFAKSKEDLQLQLAYYYSLITRIDEQIGKVMTHLKQSGEFEQTVIVFTSDHGDFAGEHGLMNKNMGIYEAIHRIPFMIKYPGMPVEGTSSGEMMESVDLYPTLCDLCHVKAPSDVQGKSILPIIEQGEPGLPHTVSTSPAGGYAGNRANTIRTPKYRLVYYGSEISGELYDTEKDPGELHNLYEDPDYQAVRLSLMENMFDHMNRHRTIASVQSDAVNGRKQRNTMLKMIHKHQAPWKDVARFYRE